MDVAGRTYTIVRGGALQEVRIQDVEDAVGLGTELVLLERITAAGAEVHVDCLGRWVERDGDPDAAELLQILQDGREALNARALAQLRRDYPALDEELEMDIIEQESEQIAADLENCAQQAKTASTDGPAPAADAEKPVPPDDGATDSVEPSAEADAAVDVDRSDEAPPPAVEAEIVDVAAVEAAMEGLESAAATLAAEVGNDPAESEAPVGQAGEACPADEPAVAIDPSEIVEPELVSAPVSASACESAPPEVNECQTVDTKEVESESEIPVVAAGGVSDAAEVPLAAHGGGAQPDPDGAALQSAAQLLERYAEQPAMDVRAIDQVEEGFERLSKFFSQGAAQTWRQARTALEQAMAFAEQVQQVREQALTVLEQVKSLRQEAMIEAQGARTHCREVMDSRDDAWRALQRTTASVGEAQVYADRASTDADRAAQSADQARQLANAVM